MPAKTNPQEKIIVALDLSPFSENFRILEKLKGRAVWVKTGLRTILAEGPGILKELNDQNLKIFLDLKLHDIPTTVASALTNLLPLGFDMVTLHVAGGRNMLKACREAVDNFEGTRKPLLLGVTLLTSLDHTDIRDMGVMYSVPGHVKRLAEIAQQSGMDGVIASGAEISVVRKACGNDFQIVTPGIRPGGSETPGGDQARVMSPREAIELGCNFLVIGRPIIAADDPAKAFDEVVGEIG